MSHRDQDAREFADMLHYVANCVEYYQRVNSYDDCNNCGIRNKCAYCPRPGEQVRINCPLWQDKDGFYE